VGNARTDMPLIILSPFPAFHTALNVYNMRFPPHVSHALRFQSQQLMQGLSNCRTLIRFDEVYVVYFKTSEGHPCVPSVVRLRNPPANNEVANL